MGVTYSQFFPPCPTHTKVNFPGQKGKVFMVTGGTSGVGFELCAILYQAGGKVYLAGRYESNAQIAISKIKASFPILPGVSLPPLGSVSTQGHKLQMAANCLGHYLLTQLLLTTLLHTAESAPPAEVRVIWTSSLVVDLSAPKGGITISDLTDPAADKPKNYLTDHEKFYLDSKTGNWFLASALAAQVSSKGILSVTQNSGNLKTSLLRHALLSLRIVIAPLLYAAEMGAYTELWAGLSKDLGIEDGGKYVLPWGRLHPSTRPDLLAALKTREDGGTGVAAPFTDYCEKQTAVFR